MDEILGRIADDPDVISAFTAEEVDEAQTAILQVAENAEGEALEDAEAVAQLLAARRVAIAEAEEAKAAKLASIRKSLGVDDTTPEEDDDDDDEPEAEEAVEVVEEPEPVAVTAAAPKARPSLKAIAAKAPKESKPTEPPVALVASGEHGNGQTFTDRLELGRALKVAHDNLGGARKGERRTVASFDTLSQHRYVIQDGDSAEEAVRVFDAVTRIAEQGSEPGVGALTAAGGFCAPAEPRYEFFNIASRSGLLNLPSVGAARGRVTYPVSPSLADFFPNISGIATEWTGANDAEPTDPATKPVYTFECPSNVTCEVIAWPTILQFGNFVARFYPEAVANATALAMIAAERTVNAARIAAIVAQASSVNAEDTTAGGLVSVITNLASAASDYRARYGMAPDATLDAAAPSWVPDALVADAIARDSTVDYGDLRRRVLAALADLNLRIQWVYDLDEASDNLFPQTTDFLLWAPGTVIELDAGTLDLGVVRDSTLNSTNDYQTFVEPFAGWCFPGHEVLLVNDVEVCPTGGTGDRVTIPCPAVS